MTEAVQEIKIQEVLSPRGIEGFIVPPDYRFIKASKFANNIYDQEQKFDKLNEFADYCQQFKNESSRIIPSDDSFLFDMNYHTNELPSQRSGDHTAKFDLRKDPDFARWERHNGRFMGQKEFADFMADYAKDFYEIDKTQILDIAKKIKVVSEGTVNSEYENGSLDVMFASKEKATFGDKQIPEIFEIALPVYHGFNAYVIPVRVFWVKEGTKISLKYELVRLHLVTDKAYADAAEKVAKETGVKVYGYGLPATGGVTVTASE